MSKPSKSLSIVVPFFDESKNFAELYRRLRSLADSFNYKTTFIFVDDGSHDNTLALVKEAAVSDPKVKYLSFSRNFGHQIAISAGIDYAKTDYIAIIDGDLQDPPEVIGQLLQKAEEGYNVVYGIRVKRKEPLYLKFINFLFYRLLQRAVGDLVVPLDAGDFCVMDKKVADVLRSLPERNRYVRGIRAWAGFNQTGVAYEREKRFEGTSKYPFRKRFRLGVDALTSLSQFPIHLCAYLGYAISALGLIGIIYVVILKLTVPDMTVGWASLITSIFFMSGIQLVMLSIVGSYTGRIYIEVQNRPLYILRETSVFEAS